MLKRLTRRTVGALLLFTIAGGFDPLLAVERVALPEYWGSPETLSFFSFVFLIFAALVRLGVLRRIPK